MPTFANPPADNLKPDTDKVAADEAQLEADTQKVEQDEADLPKP